MGISLYFMVLKNRRRVYILLLSLVFGLVSCESSRDVSPIEPDEITLLIITFQPSPVTESSDGKYHFVVIVDEMNNVGATITSVKLESLDDDGDVVDVDRHNEEWVRDTFGSSYIKAYGRLAGSVVLKAASNSSRENWILRGTDDEGNSFEYSQSVELISR